MPKFKKQTRDDKINNAKRLYVKGFDLQFISEVIEVSLTTLEKWAKENDFETARRASQISISEIRNEILNTYEVMKNGGKPTMSPDQISKLVASFEKLTPSQKSLTWIIEAFEMLTESYLEEIKNSNNNAEKNKNFDILKTVRTHCDKVISKITKQIL